MKSDRQGHAPRHHDGFDHFLTEVLQAPYVRYVDAAPVLGDIGAEPAQAVAEKISVDVAAEHVGVPIAIVLIDLAAPAHPDKTFIASTTETATFVGFVGAETFATPPAGFDPSCN